MSNRLRSRELCPLHHSYFCPCHAGGSRVALGRFQVAVEIIEDPRSVRGFREICSAHELRRRKHILLERHPFCYYCKKKFTLYAEVELAHLIPKGMNGCFRDDAMENLALAHMTCNRENGSKRPG
jgi:5-methylcytosine-specific restriction endonuclease McrA